MIGEYLIEVRNSDIAYKFKLRRNFTVLRGDGATGKSILCDLIFANNEHPGQGVTVKVTRGARIEVLSRLRFQDGILNSNTLENVIFVIDEDAEFIKSNDFAVAAIKSGCYFLLITREKLAQIPCSIKEVYELEHITERWVGFRPIYTQTHYGTDVQPNMMIATEDSGAGRQLFSRQLGESRVTSVKGKDNFLKKLESKEIRNCILVADGAAFGFIITDILPLLKDCKCHLIVEESFEYVVLISGVIPDRLLGGIDLDNPLVDSSKFSSWEKYYEDLLVSVTKHLYSSYKKDHLPQEFSQYKNVVKIFASYDLSILLSSEETSIFGGG